MKIKSLLLGSAAALVAVSGARAADAVVIPEPEAVEYVRVCDAAGTGYYYIPGTETCLKIGGYVQYQLGFANYNAVTGSFTGPTVAPPVIAPGGFNVRATQQGWNTNTEARLQIDSWTDSELGAVTTQIRMTAGNANTASSAPWAVDRATLSVGGLSMGLMGSLYDFHETGAADDLVANGNTRNSIQYTANFGAGTFAIQLQDDEAAFAGGSNWVPDVIVKGTYTAGDLALAGALVYQDNNAAASQWGAKVTAKYAGFGAMVQYTGGNLITPAVAGLASVVWDPTPTPVARFEYRTATAPVAALAQKNGNIAGYRWVLGANYGFDATAKLNLNLGVAYGIRHGGFADNDFVIGAEAKYKLTETMEISARLRYLEDINNSTPVDTSGFDGRIRFKASF